MQRLTIWRRAALTLAVALMAGGLFAACGGGGEGSDEDYAKAICESSDALEDVLTAAIAAAFDSDADEPDMSDLIAAYEDWLDQLEDANPPSDVEDFHNGLVDGVRDAIEAMERGDADIESAFDAVDDLPDPPQAVQDRIAAAAAELPECDGVDFFS